MGVRATWIATKARVTGPARVAGVPILIATVGVLGAVGVLGGGNVDEHYDTWQTVLRPAGGDAVHSTLTFDQDFGRNRRHGPELHVDNDLGLPVEVEAHSPDAPDQVATQNMGPTTRIRVGDPDQTISGLHRYTVAFTYPRGLQGRDLLAIDVVNADDFTRDAVEVVVTGFELTDTHCFVGEPGSTDDTGCQLAEGDDGTYRVTLDRLHAGEGLTIEGRVTGRTDAVTVTPPPVPPDHPENHRATGVGLAGLAAASATAPYLALRRRGRNQVAGDGSVDAAFGSDGSGEPGPTRLVSDAGLEDLATTEFAPPEGLEPWQGNVIQRERIDDDTVVAYFSGLVADGAITLTERDGAVTIGAGPNFTSIDPNLRGQVFRRLFGTKADKPHRLGHGYDADFAEAWSGIERYLRRTIRTSDWWTSGNPADSKGPSALRVPILFSVGMVFATLILPLAVPFGIPRLLRSWWVAVPLAIGLPMVAAYFAYRHLAPVRSAAGSALAIRTASFRRFLAASEGQHVTWAWEREVVRSYSAWAIALGVADAWRRSLDDAGIPEAAAVSGQTFLVADLRHDLAAAGHLPPATGVSSGSSSSSSFSSSSSSSGGSVGGGGGGVSGGSW